MRSSEITVKKMQSKIDVVIAPPNGDKRTAYIQCLFERLSWIENRVASLGEKPIRS